MGRSFDPYFDWEGEAKRLGADEAAFQAVRQAAALIDMAQHRGLHPRVGATDVLPFVPLRGATLEQCVEIARLVGRRTTAVMPQPYSSRRRSSCGWRRTSVKPARCSTFQKRLLPFEKLWPATAALEAGLRPQKITSRPLSRISDS